MEIVLNVNNIGQYLKLKMAEKNMGVREVAKEIGTSSATISRITAGKMFDIRLIRPIAMWCDISPEELFNLLPDK